MHGRLSGDGRPERAAATTLLKPVGYLLLILGTTAALAQAPAEQPVDVVPAWEGYYRSGRATELTLVARASGEAELRARVLGSVPPASMEIAIGAGETRLGIALRPAGPALTVTSSIGTGAATEHPLELIALTEPLIAIVADSTPDLLPWLSVGEGAATLPVAMADLPRTAAGYEPLSGLAMDADVRPLLAPAQVSALTTYLESCGRVFTTQAATHAALIETAGCGGRFVTRVDEPRDMAAQLRVEADALPRHAELRALLGGPPRLVYVAAIFLGLYCLFVALLAWRRLASGWALPAAPLLASLLMLAVWLRDTPESRLIVWAEAEAQEPARYRAVVELYSQGIGEIAIPLDAALDTPVTFTDSPAELFARDRALTLRWQPQLLSRLVIGVDGSTAVNTDLAIEPNRAGDGTAVSVRNRGASQSAAALLTHERRYYRVPPLAPGESWAPTATTPTLSRGDVPAPLAAAGRTALLVPLAADEIPAELPRADVEAGWLLRRADGALL